jgi:hypothetical protein
MSWRCVFRWYACNHEDSCSSSIPVPRCTIHSKVAYFASKCMEWTGSHVAYAPRDL